MESTTPSFAQSVIFKATLVCFAITSLSIVLRLLSKLRTGKREFAVDDGAMLISYLFFVWFCGIALKIAVIEQQHPQLTHKVADEFLLQITIGEGVFLLSTISLKVSLMLFYRQFVWQKWQRHAILVAGASSIALSMIAFFLCIFQCGTLNNLANKHIEGRCISRNRYVPLLYVHGATGAITDWTFALLPIAVLIKSNLAPHVKLSVCCLLSLGVTGSLAACFRTVYVYGIYFEAKFLDPTFHPTFYDHSAPEILTALIELGFGISAASLACLQPLLRHFLLRAKNWFEKCKNLYSGRRTPSPKGNAGLLPSSERQCQRGMAGLPTVPRIAVQQLVHGLPTRGATQERSRDISVQRKPSLGFLPSVGSILELENEDGNVNSNNNNNNVTGGSSRRRWRNSIGMLPMLATLDDEDLQQRAADFRRASKSMGVIPSLATVDTDELDFNRVDSWAAVARAVNKDVDAVK